MTAAVHRLIEREEELCRVIMAAVSMRDAQRRFYKADKGSPARKRALKESLDREKYFDAMAETVLKSCHRERDDE
jgi:hypothetical protein